MSTALSDIEGVEIVVDDSLVHGRTQKEHDERVIKELETVQTEREAEQREISNLKNWRRICRT